MKKKGISLIVLVITIVVIIILAAAVILSLGQNNPINSARVANVSGTKDSIQSSILVYSSNVKAKTLGELSTEKILTDSEYKVVTDDAPIYITKDSVETSLWAINTLTSKDKLSVEVKNEGNGVWYTDKYGKVYLIFANMESIPAYLKDGENILSSVSNFVAISNGTITTGGGSSTPTVVKYTASDIASMTDTEKQSVIGKSVSLTSTNGWNNWKVFSSDGTNIMLIAGDYVDTSFLQSDHGFDIGNYNILYCVYSLTSRDDLISKLKKASTFNGFKDEDAKVTEARIPTIEDFALSYNAVDHSGATKNDKPVIQEVYYKDNGVNVGYNVAAGSAVLNSSYGTGYGFPLTEDNYGNLWVINDTTKAEGYWLASASSRNTVNVFHIHYNGRVLDNSYDSANHGLRPVVVLDSSVKLVQNTYKDDIIYTLE